MAKKNLSPEERAAKKAAQEARDKKRLAAVEAKTKARKEAEEKGLPWNDAVQAARFLEDYDAAFMSAIAGTPKTDDEPVVSPKKEELEAMANPAQKSTAELLKAAKEAVGRTTEETPVVTGETANDNSEEIEPLSTTGVSVTTEENPESDTPAKEAPEETVDNSYDPDNPATWLTDTNGGLVRLPSESNKAYGKRKHKYKTWKRAQTVVLEDTTGRNDDVPEAKHYPTGDFGPGGYNSDEDGQSLPPPEKSAKESANTFETAAMEGTNEPAAETKPEVLDTPDTTEAAPDAEQTEAPVTEETETNNAAQPNTTEQSAPEVQQPVVEASVQAKSTLTLASSQTEDEALANRAQKFYGDTWTAERAEKLTKAFKFLEMAIRLQQKGESESRVNMPMTSAIRLETEALGIAVAATKAA